MQARIETNHTLGYVICAATISLLAHLALVGLAGRIPIHIFAYVGREAEAPDYRPVIRIFEEPLIDDSAIDGEGLDGDVDPDFPDAGTPGEDLVKRYFEEIELIVPPKPSLELAGVGSNIVLPSPPQPTEPVVPTAPRPEIVAMDDDGLSLDDLHRRWQIPDIPRAASAAPHLPSLLADGPLADGALPPLQVGMRLPRPNASPPGSIALPQRTAPPLAPAPGEEDFPPPTSMDTDLPGPDRPEQYQPMDALLNVTLHAYLPPTGDGYFRINVSPNPRSSAMRAIPKDVLLLIDCSASISPGLLSVFKESAQYALDFLNPRDRFNVVAFRTAPEPLFESFVPVNRQAIAQAKEYVAGLPRGGMTDVYASLAPFVSMSRGELTNPLLVYLLSDGESTVRHRLDNDEFLRKVAQVNRADVTIYTASVGGRANRFLLDLLSYSNRGLPLHREKYAGFDRVLAQFMGMHNDIIVADMQYGITGGLEGGVFPRRLPHLYRGSTLSIYGRFPRHLKTVGLRLTGTSADGRMQEMVYQGDLTQANRPGADLGYEWVGQKVFDLVIRNVLDPRPEYAREIRRMKDQYNLQIPYF